MSTLTNQSFGDELSFEIRFRVAPKGNIIESNHNGHELIKANGAQLFYHFSKASRHQVFLFFKEMIRSVEVIEKVLYQKINGETKKVRYRGRFDGQDVLLVGYEMDEDRNDQSISPVLQKSESVLNVLNLCVLVFDKNNHMAYCNSTFIKDSLGSTNDRSIIDAIEDMTREIRNKKKLIQRFHVYAETLFHVKGLYIEEGEEILFIIDNRTRTDEFDSLMRHKQQMESVSHLAAGFAHELRNPLSVIRGFIQLSGLTNNIEKYYQTILSEIDRMNNIVEDFLSLSRKASRKKLQIPSELFQSLIPLIRPECLLRQINFVYSFGKTPKKLFVDDSMIKQIILNLLRNTVEAFEAGGDNKYFEIRSKAVGNHYHITVSDNGPGMNQAVLDQLGKPFFTTKENGTGIGLPLCKKIVGDHQGEFLIESAIGKGTTITLILPLTENDES